jgi:hypothetical protein
LTLLLCCIVLPQQQARPCLAKRRHLRIGVRWHNPLLHPIIVTEIKLLYRDKMLISAAWSNHVAFYR